MSYQLPELPYSYDALEPYIDAETMKIHHDKHHAGYIQNLNNTLAEHPELQNQPIDALLSRLQGVPESVRVEVRNNGGGHYNHSLFWTVMKRDGGGAPRGELSDAIKSAFGSFVEFKSKFSQAALKQFGSGWAWLCLRHDELDVISTSNQDNPLTVNRGEPILGLDVWEHAYYLHYKNRRADYVDAWWNVVNWEQVAENLAAARNIGRVFGLAVSEETGAVGLGVAFPRRVPS